MSAGRFFVAAKAWVRKSSLTLLLRDKNGDWDLPGGRVDDAEFGMRSLFAVLARELEEEIKLKVDDGKMWGTSQWTRPARPKEDPGEKRIFVVHYQVSAPEDFEPQLSDEHGEFAWVENPFVGLPSGLLPEVSPGGAAAREVKPIEIPIPGFRNLEIHSIVSDFTGTLAFRGALRNPARLALLRLAHMADVHVVTSDTFGTAKRELAGIPITFKKLTDESEDHDVQKERYVESLGTGHVAAFGNGRNDRRMLEAVRSGRGLAVAVDNGEGCAREAFDSSEVFVAAAENALDLLLDKDRCKATLRV